ncbi:uncharacterized protein BX664DRAFT_293598 [Halteromyces radiatus]|uniref:uncharacterized protein n=1 Tax=Halteromyces radiatus TaxID=101107 RepID=UPI00222037FF|nr:uncharacterized protein BX664DRAFT_293598 [Halteromyces radiatus]KAI8092505.1 hypothetical protein BX664DRAFT_293598 [Halteromyces radiatus]
MTTDVSLSCFDGFSLIYSKSTQGKGREYVAKQIIDPGTTVLKVTPYATAIFDSFKKRLCARCLCAHPTKSFSTHCLGCDQVYFCSIDCANKYLKWHDPGCCDVLRKLASLKKVDRHMKSVAKLVVMIYWQRQKNNEDNSYTLVQHLESHYDDWDQDIKRDWHRIHTFLWKHISALGWLLPHETDADIMHLVSKIESNGFGIYLENRLDVVAGRALYPLASLFNHDCAYNCQPRGKFREMTIRTLSTIQKEDPLTIAYTDTDLPVMNRRQKLLQDYYFTCQCNRCLLESASKKRK